MEALHQKATQSQVTAQQFALRPHEALDLSLVAFNWASVGHWAGGVQEGASMRRIVSALEKIWECKNDVARRQITDPVDVVFRIERYVNTLAQEIHALLAQPGFEPASPHRRALGRTLHALVPAVFWIVVLYAPDRPDVYIDPTDTASELTHSLAQKVQMLLARIENMAQ